MPSVVAGVKDPGLHRTRRADDDHITCQALASRRFEITFSGPGGHSWSDFGIGNPVHALSRAIAFFTDDPSTRLATPTSFLQLRDDRRWIEH